MVKKRTTYPDTLKARVALEAVKGVKTISELSSRYKVHPNVIAKWKKKLLEKAPDIFRHGNGGRASDGEALTASLYEEIGRLKMENNWLKKKL